MKNEEKTIENVRLRKDLKFKYEHSNEQRTYTDEDGKQETFAICDACGKEHKNNFGLEVSYSMRNNWTQYRIKLCGKCANKVVPILDRATEEIEGIVDGLKREAGLLPPEE